MGTQGGLLVVICDDPSGHSSGNEQDSRPFAKIADLPLLEPSSWQEAKEMAKWSFTLSEEIKNVVLLRGVTRISHSRGNVTLGKLPQLGVSNASFDKSKPRIFVPVVQKHAELHNMLMRLEKVFAQSQFNQYGGPRKPEVLIITCGTGWLYSQDALEMIGVKDRVGILKIGTIWPLPAQLIVENLARTDKVLFVEEVDSFLEGNVKEIVSDFSARIGPKNFFGKKSEHIPVSGEMNTDRIIEALGKLLQVSYRSRDAEYDAIAGEVAGKLPDRALVFCPGCPHRASLWAIKNALQLDNREGFVTGDVGCYTMGMGPTGFNLLKTVGAMGSGTGLANGFGKLAPFGFNQPAVAVCGDSTFYHAAMPALVNAQFNKSNLVMVILDNSATAMTGFQPHPGVGVNTAGEKVAPVDIEAVCRAFWAKVWVTDPFDLQGTRDILLGALEDPVGVKVVIMRRKCATLQLKEAPPSYKVEVDPEKCVGEDCGCNRLCVRVFRCPGLVWDKQAGRAMIDDAICVGCGVCADICPERAIIKKG
jgi:indolepyruvate ferredoxin oxidoreductase alpha subunit